MGASKNKILLLIIGILLVTNIIMLFFFVGKKEPGHKDFRAGRDAYLADFLHKEIGFNDSQLAQFTALNKQHRENVKSRMDSMRNEKEQLVKELGSHAFNDSSINLLATQSAEKQKLMEVQMLQYFKAIRNLCNKEQQPKFDSLFYKVIHKKRDRTNHQP